ncbi:DUF4269 domain-containing protein [Aquibacillus albus]|uniref:DUF4269 domain-containing protein n=1 Tax=Aquibacillus albus TaxID=1168171 RepID=A0ABS2N5L6_9BACI|nr:DUF4269 domain-containing protein [Aquibacillus albus]MBM7573408.1 hypothetical protein [Aquibacillus albus]
MFDTITYLKTGNEKQQKAYSVIRELGIIDDLLEYHPTLCGTVPIGVDTEESDLDIIFEVYDGTQFEKKLVALYGDKRGFRFKNFFIRDLSVVKTNFFYKGFEFELFGQPQPVKQQYAYIHMVIEHAIMEEFPHVREQVIRLKQEGLKTEPAFCEVLGLTGDPYLQLIEYGKEKGFFYN